MKQWVTLMDGIDNLQLQDVEDYTNIAENEVLVKIAAVSINHRDVKIINGDFKGRYEVPSKPTPPCSDCSGTVVRIGGPEAAKAWREGDRVIALVRPSHLTGPTLAKHHAEGLGFPQPGVLAEYRVFNASGLVRIPTDTMSFEEAATLPIAATTAWMALNWDRPIGQPRQGKDTTVLLLGTGGVSIAALTQARHLGLTVIVTSSDYHKLQRARELGADHTVNYKSTPDWGAEVLKITDGKGADVIVETGGPETMPMSLKAVAEGGNISAVGILSGMLETKGQLATGLSLINRNATLKGINIGPRDRVEEMLAFYKKSEACRPVIGRLYGFEDVKDAMRNAASGTHFGKMVIIV